MNWFSRFLLFLYNRRVRKTKEDLAYWTAKDDTYKVLCSGRHTSYERNDWVEARAKKAFYQARLEALKENPPS